MAAFWEILISSLQREAKGRGEGIGGVQQGGGVQTISIMAWYLMIKYLLHCNSFQPAVHSYLKRFSLFFMEDTGFVSSGTLGIVVHGWEG